MDALSNPLPPGQLPSDPEDLDPALRAFRLILAASHLMRSAMDTHLRPSGLTTQQAAVMSIVEANGPSALGIVAERLGTSHQNVRQIVDAMVEKGFLAEHHDPADRRRRIIELTPHALSFWADRQASDTEVVQQWFEPLTADQRSVLADLLGTLVENSS